MLMTANQWARRGYRIRTGARSFHRGAGGVALFSDSQVTPWDYAPPHFNQPRNVIEVNGRYYREI